MSHAHFAALLPESVLRGDRKLLIIVHTTGHSTNNFSYALKHYLRVVGCVGRGRDAELFTSNNAPAAPITPENACSGCTTT